MEPESPPRGSTPQRPRMGPTRPATLVVAGLAAAALAWLMISRFYGKMPDLTWFPPLTLVALAVLEAYAAFNTKARIDRRPGREPVDPLAVARYVVLAKASSLAGAIFAGFYAGMLVWLLIERQRNSYAAADTPPGTAGVVASLALVAAALWLERACRVPERPDDDEEPGTKGE